MNVFANTLRFTLNQKRTRTIQNQGSHYELLIHDVTKLYAALQHGNKSEDNL